MYPITLEKLMAAFKLLPGVGQKTAERYALSVLENNDADIQAFSESLIAAKTKIKPCPRCGNLTDGELCTICSDDSRNQKLICVVANAKEVISIEKTQEFKGLYHVLGGLISTKKGILPEDLEITALLERAQQADEIILALNATVEGEMTSLYLAKKLVGISEVTRLAFGLPIGGHLDYADDMTLIKAFEGRRKVE